MKPWRYAALPLALLASHARAENWVKVGTEGSEQIDKDSIRRGSDGLLYFADRQFGVVLDWAADCQRRAIYLNDDGKLLEWSVSKTQLSWVCANAP